MANPYTSLPVTDPDYFVATRGGRGEQAHRLLSGLLRKKPRPDSLSLVGERRFGKTSLLGFLRRGVERIPGVVAAAVDMLSLERPDPEGFHIVLTQALQHVRAVPATQPAFTYLDFREFLQSLSDAGRRLILFIDEFDIVARDRRFPLGFFNNLRAVCMEFPLVLVIASVAPLAKIAHDDAHGSPFFNFFVESRLGLLSPAEARALICTPPGDDAGVGEVADEILPLAGRQPFFLQRACSCAWDLRAAGGLSVEALRAAFAEAVQVHWQYIWDHSTPDEQRAFCALVHGTRGGEKGFSTLVQRGYVSGEPDWQVCGTGLTEFLRRCCEATPATCAATPQPRPLAPPPAPPAPGATSARKRALVVGVDRYRHQQSGKWYLNPLRHAEADAVKVGALLKDLGFEVCSLLGTEATLARLVQTFADLQRATAGELQDESCFVFHFSGHGQIDPQDEDTAYLVLHDTDPCNLRGTGLEMSQFVYKYLRRVQVMNSLVLLDACHAGFAAGVRDLTPVSRLPNIAQQLFDGLHGRMLLAACTGAAQAREKAELGHGVFTYHVLRHWRDLDGAHPPNPVTVFSLVDYLGRVMPRDHPDVPLPVFSGTGVAFELRRT